MAKTDSLGQFEQLVLSAVSVLRDNAYGVPIHAKVGELAGKPANLGSVYVTLDRLEEKGYLSSTYSDPAKEPTGKAKRYYHVEAPGALALQEATATSKRLVDAVGSWRVGKWRPHRAK